MPLRSTLLGAARTCGRRVREDFSDGLQPDSARVDILRARCGGRSRGFRQACAMRRRSALALSCIVGEGRGCQRGRYGRAQLTARCRQKHSGREAPASFY